ncbi:hypothetical protein WN943_027047 [Citrus x changshan-huyou]
MPKLILQRQCRHSSLFKLSFLSFGGADGWVYVMEPYVMVVVRLMAVSVVGADGWVRVMVTMKRMGRESSGFTEK